MLNEIEARQLEETNTQLRDRVTKLEEAVRLLSKDLESAEEQLTKCPSEEELGTAVEQAKGCEKLIAELFAFLQETEAGNYDQHVYRKEKARLRHWACELDLEVLC